MGVWHTDVQHCLGVLSQQKETVQCRALEVTWCCWATEWQLLHSASRQRAANVVPVALCEHRARLGHRAGG